MNILFADCFSGISGDMLLGALIELGINKDWLQKNLSDIGLPPFTIKINTVKRGAIRCTQCRITSDEPKGIKRGIKEITDIIQNSHLKKKVQDQALDLFQCLARIEAKIHGIPVSEVHFHEVGAIDALVEILGVLIAVDHLGIEEVYASPLPVGHGIINTVHGPIPIPAPATLAILKEVPIIHTGVEAELVTPTGALLIKHLAKGFGIPPKMVIKRIGYGAGSREFRERPNCLRLIWGESDAEYEEEYIELLECDVDDMNPEFCPCLMENLFNAGALDVTLTQTIMKKGRPGIRVSVLSEINDTKKLTSVLLTQTSTIGVRIHSVSRHRALRKIITIQTRYGPVRFKCAWQGDQLLNIAPEYEDYYRISRRYNRPIKSVYQEIMAEASKQTGNLDKQGI